MNWYKKAKINESVKEPTPQELKKLVEELIRGAWQTPYIDKESKYSTDQIRLIIDNEQYLSELAYQYGDDYYYTILDMVEKEIIKKEESIFKTRSTRLQKQDPLHHINKVIKGKSWDNAKKAIVDQSVSGYIDTDYVPDDQQAEETFQRLYTNTFQPTYASLDQITGMSPYTTQSQGDELPERYIKRLSEIEGIPYEDIRRTDKGALEDPMQYEENTLFREIFGHKTDTPSKTIEIYRGVSRADANLRPGDYVTASREYARSYIRGNVGKIIRQEVNTDDLILMKLNPVLNEFIYYPRNTPPPEEIEIPFTFKEYYQQINPQSYI